MQLRIARLCLDCDEIHDAQVCPLCASEVFAYLTRWVPAPDLGRRPKAPQAQVYGATGTTPVSSPKWRVLVPGVLGVGALGIAGWMWRGGANPKTARRGSAVADSTPPEKGARPMSLRDKYNHAIQTAKSFRMDGSAEERDGKLYFKGTVETQDQANKIWDAIKTVPSWQQEVVADVRARAQAPTQQATTTYTVKSGDTLSKIAKEFLGDANAYKEIFEMNRDQLSDPDKIKPGQVLKIPQHAHR